MKTEGTVIGVKQCQQALVVFCCLVFSILSFAKNLIIGSALFNPPFEVWASKGNVNYGYDIDIMTEICRRINAQCVFKHYPFSDLFDQINERKIDLAIASIIISDDRKDSFLFSLPYLQSYSQFITSTKSSIYSINDINGITIGVRKGSVYKNIADGMNRNNQVIEYPSVMNVFNAVAKNDVDVGLLDYEAAKYWNISNPGYYRLIGEKSVVGEGYGIMSSKDNSELIQQINQALLAMESDGTFLRIYSDYFY